jgi:histidine triad (HIT) family protein
MADCIFCRIINGEIPSTRVYADEQVYAFRDAHPQAPVHVLIVPRKHYAGVDEMAESDRALLGHMLLTAKKVAEMEGVAKSGYREVINTGREGGQVVMHLHLHVLGGRPLAGELG